MERLNIPLMLPDIHDTQVFALAQCAGRAGLPVIGLSAFAAPWAERSRYIIRFVRVVDLAHVLPGFFCRELARLEPGPAVWLPAYDDTAWLTATCAAHLRQADLRFCVPDIDQLEASEPAALQDFNGRLKIPWACEYTLDALLGAADSLPYPVLLKSRWGQHVRLDNAASLLAHLQRQVWEEHQRFQVSRYVPGPVQRMCTAMLLFDARSRVIRGFTGRRLRVAATRFGQFGETTAAVAEWLPGLYEAAAELLTHLRWRGIAEVECKQAPDGHWYLLEINPRPSGWMCLAEADGAGLLDAYHRICTTDDRLEEALLQRSESRYVRLLGSVYHPPDWACDAVARDHPVKKAGRLLMGMIDRLRYGPRLIPGAWDGADRQASMAILRHTLAAVSDLARGAAAGRIEEFTLRQGRPGSASSHGAHR